MEALPLKDRHSAKNALLGERDLCELALSYGDVFGEYRAALEGAALHQRSRAILRFEGEDRLSWLHGMTTNDVKNLPEGKGQLTTLCTARGKMLGLGFLSRRREDVLLDLDPLCRRPSLESLERLLITEDVSIFDETGQLVILSLVGPKAGEALGRLLPEAKIPKDLLDLDYVNFMGTALSLRRSRLGTLPAFDIFAPLGVAGELFDLLSGELPLLGAEAAEILRIEGGERRYGKDVSDATIPQEAGLDEAISYTKGCYLGQETIARLHYRGHVNRHLRGFVLAEGAKVPEEGAAVYVSGEEKGKISSACLSPRLGRAIAIGYIRREFAEPGTECEVATGAEKAGAVVSLLPLA